MGDDTRSTPVDAHGDPPARTPGAQDRLRLDPPPRAPGARASTGSACGMRGQGLQRARAPWGRSDRSPTLDLGSPRGGFDATSASPVPPRAICHGRPIPKNGVAAARRQRQFGESARDAASSSRSAPAPPAGERQGRGSRSQPPPCIVRPELQGLGFRRQPDRPRRVTPHHEVNTSPLPRTVRQRHPCWWGAAPSAAVAVD